MLTRLSGRDPVGEDDGAGVEGERAGQFQLDGRGRAEQQAARGGPAEEQRVEAYSQLASEGYLASYAGGYTQVAAGAPAPAPAVARLCLGREALPRIDLSYGRADVSSFPRAAWLRAIRGALATAPNDLFGYLSGSGVPQLRTAIAAYLNRVRGTVAHRRDPGGPAGRIRRRRRDPDAVPPVADMAAAKIAADRGSPALEQLALADLIAGGEFDRHLRRMRPVYRRRAAPGRLAAAGAGRGHHGRRGGPGGGGVDGVAPYRISHPGPGGLIFGYAAASEQAMAEGVGILAGGENGGGAWAAPGGALAAAWAARERSGPGASMATHLRPADLPGRGQDLGLAPGRTAAQDVLRLPVQDRRRGLRGLVAVAEPPDVVRDFLGAAAVPGQRLDRVAGQRAGGRPLLRGSGLRCGRGLPGFLEQRHARHPSYPWLSDGMTVAPHQRDAGGKDKASSFGIISRLRRGAGRRRPG